MMMVMMVTGLGFVMIYIASAWQLRARYISFCLKPPTYCTCYRPSFVRRRAMEGFQHAQSVSSQLRQRCGLLTSV